MERSKTFKHLHIFQDDGAINSKYIEDFEKQYGICLPKTYKELILKHNGAYLKESYFDFINKSGEEDMRSFAFKSFGEPERGKELITDAPPRPKLLRSKGVDLFRFHSRR